MQGMQYVKLVSEVFQGLDTQWHTVCSKDELWEKLFVENFCTDSDFAPSSWFKEFK